MRITSAGNIGIGTATPIAALQVTSPTINETGGSTSITRGLYVSPNPLGSANVLQANDYRALETSAYTLVLASTTATSQIYGSLFNQQTINTTTVATLANASNVYISGAPRSTSNLTITSSTALTIIGGTVNTTTNAYALYAVAPTGATNNYSGVFTGGNFGIGTTTPSGVMHVVGQCVTGDTKLRRRRKRKNKNGEWEDYFEEVDIVNIKPGDEILTFNEHSGRFVVSKVKQLADMGVKTIYKLTTASGKTIRTTANHPYFVRPVKLLTGTFEADQSWKVENLSKDTYIAIANEGFSDVLKLDRRIRRQQQEWYRKNGKIRFFGPALWAYAIAELINRNNISRAVLVVDAEYTGFESFIKQIIQSRTAGLDIRFDKVGRKSPAHYAAHGAYTGQNKKRSGAPGVTGKPGTRFFPIYKLGSGRPSSSRLITMYQKVLDVSRGGEWLKAERIQPGWEVATVDGWEKIVSVKILPEEQVYDIEVEGTHNFVGNGIVAHNTAIFNSNVGIGTTSPIASLAVVGSGGLNPFVVASSTGTQLLTVTQSGNVGIGTAVPGAKLEVSATTATPQLRVKSSVAGDAAGIEIQSTDTGGIQWRLNSLGNIANRVGNFEITPVGSSAAVAITTTGNVGIGTTNPTNAKLEIIQTAASEGLRVDGASGGFAFVVKGGTTYTSHVRAGLTVGANYFTTPPSNGAIIEGNVGIGTTSPSGALHVYASDQPRIIVDRANTGSAGLVSFRTANVQDWAVGAQSSGNNFTIYGGSTPGDKLVITTAGNVGIGTTTPGRTLTVVGDIRATGILYDSTNSAGTSGNFLMSTATGYQWTATSTLFGGAQVTGSGTNGYVTRWTAANTVSTGILLDNGTVAGVNATSSTISFNVQGSGTLDPFNVASSSGTSIFRVTSAGNVGIGTTTPGSNLTVKPSAAAQGITVRESDDGQDAVRLDGYVNGGLFQMMTGGATTISFNTTEAAGVNYFNTGNIGVGTTTPVAKLAVQGTAGNNALLDIASSTGTSVLRVAPSGNVGIGITAPTETLHVVGSEKVSLYSIIDGVYIGYPAANDIGNANDGSMIRFSTNDLLLKINGGNTGVGTSTPIATLQVTGGTINETGGSTSITRGLYVSPNPLGTANVLQANDYRALETSGYTLVLASTTATSQIYGSLFNQQTINTTTVATLANASNVYISGAPRSTSNLTITSSTALTIIGGTVSTTTNAYALYAVAPTGATNNYSGVFTGGNFGIGTTTPFRRYACGGAVC